MMEPTFVTEPRLLPILEELKQREPIFHRREFSASRADFESMTVTDYWEVGASGRRYSRQFVVEELERRLTNPKPDIWQTDDFLCREIAPDNFLLTYTLTQGDRVSRRSTIWRLTQEKWKILYHQGTVVEGP